ncbi:hypothetical protein GTO89_10060 [Heliobacterium gestii]|uniref:Molybdopterin cofactor biosynthesis MoaD-related C-terminal domain-containing protein n=1 Tax=Heliomicrobium gestii TaxID=2699 RepID=A0A845LDD3_HELGE|nr:hypothetical protein [Heliomicrobium gestii]MBM7868186.1 hypothetical protein [Heliomicrobium gestii]MZP43384.1 hypothetical protein [Heliomicrobium gestii]
MLEKELRMRSITKRELGQCLVELGGVEQSPGCFEGEGWRVDLGAERKVSIGAFRLPEIAVTIRAEPDVFQRFLARFRLKTLRGG